MGLSPSTSTSSTPSSFPQKRKSFPPKFAKPSNNNNVSRVMDNRTTSLLIRVPVTPPTQVSDESLHAHFRVCSYKFLNYPRHLERSLNLKNCQLAQTQVLLIYCNFLQEEMQNM